MVDRINLLLQAKNITSRQFAEEIGIQPSGMSHILSGRNNPSLDFVMKVIRRWPEINISWLMFGKGEMFTRVVVNPPASSPVSSHQSPDASNLHSHAPEPDLFSSFEPAPAAEAVPNASPTHGVAPVPEASLASIPDSPSVTESVTQPTLPPSPASPSDSVAAAPASVAASAVATPAPPTASAADTLVEGVVPPQRLEREVAPVPVQEPAAVVASEVGRGCADTRQLDENRLKTAASSPAAVQPIPDQPKRVVKIVILYDDHTFSEYSPE